MVANAFYQVMLLFSFPYGDKIKAVNLNVLI